MNAIELLKQDHRRVLDLISEIEQTSDHAVKTRERLFERLFEMIKKHEKMEEKILYPAADNKETHDMILEAYEEHHVIDRILAEADKTAVTSDTWKAKLKVMRENLEHHIKEEEEELFPKLQENFDKSTLEKFGDKMAKLQEQS